MEAGLSNVKNYECCNIVRKNCLSRAESTLSHHSTSSVSPSTRCKYEIAKRALQWLALIFIEHAQENVNKPNCYTLKTTLLFVYFLWIKSLKIIFTVDKKTSFACEFTSIERRTIFDLWQMSYAACSSLHSLHYASQKLFFDTYKKKCRWYSVLCKCNAWSLFS